MRTVWGMNYGMRMISGYARYATRQSTATLTTKTADKYTLSPMMQYLKKAAEKKITTTTASKNTSSMKSESQVTKAGQTESQAAKAGQTSAGGAASAGGTANAAGKTGQDTEEGKQAGKSEKDTTANKRTGVSERDRYYEDNYRYMLQNYLDRYMYSGLSGRGSSFMPNINSNLIKAFSAYI